MTYPLVVRMADHTLIYPLDSLLNTWILSWDYHALTSDPRRLFDANIFYPAKRTLALSEHMLGNVPFFALPMGITGNPILAANVVVLVSFALSATTMFALVFYWTERVVPAFIAGLIYAFAPPRIGQLNHLQLLSVQWFPLVLLFGHRFLASGSMRAGLFACAFYVLQVLTSYYLGYMVTLLVVCFGAYYAAVFGSLRSPRMMAKIAFLILVAAIALVPVSHPYVLQKRDAGLLSPDRAFVVSTSADLASSFLSVPVYGRNVYHRLLGHFQSPDFTWEKWLFPGFLPILLMAIALGAARQRPPPSRPSGRWDHHTVRSHALLVLVASVMALGPVLVWNGSVTRIELPYGWLAHAIPGFSSLRVPARFGLMILPGMAVLAGLGMDVALGRLRARLVPSHRRGGQGIVGVLVLAGLILEFHFAPIPMDPIETGRSVPPVYRWLAGQAKDAVVLEVPLDLAHDPARGLILQARYTYFSVYHWRSLVNGYSGYVPPSYGEMRAHTQNLPDPRSLQYLRTLGVRYLIVHTDLLSAGDARSWRGPVPPELERTAEFGADIVYELRAGASTGEPPPPPGRGR
jgi:hypothetical protein